MAVSESANPLLTPDRFYGITQTGFLDRDAFNDIISDLTAGVHELMCHPGYVDGALRNIPTRLREQRERELELLTGTDVREALQRAGISLISYRTFVEDYGKRRPGPVLHRHSAV